MFTEETRVSWTYAAEEYDRGGVRSAAFVCDVCRYPIDESDRFHCVSCGDYDLCASCYETLFLLLNVDNTRGAARGERQKEKEKEKEKGTRDADVLTTADDEREEARMSSEPEPKRARREKEMTAEAEKEARKRGEHEAEERGQSCLIEENSVTRAAAVVRAPTEPSASTAEATATPERQPQMEREVEAREERLTTEDANTPAEPFAAPSAPMSEATTASAAEDSITRASAAAESAVPAPAASTAASPPSATAASTAASNLPQSPLRGRGGSDDAAAKSHRGIYADFLKHHTCPHPRSKYARFGLGDLD
jgi:hypothetical protein